MSTPDRIVRYKDDHLREALAGKRFLLFDGAMGTMLQRAQLSGFCEPPDLLVLTHPNDIESIQRSYVEAGCDVITTCTFNANAKKLAGQASVQEVYAAAAAIARKAGARYVAGDIGPTGDLLAPMGSLSFADAYDVFAEQVCAADEAGCDLLLIETFADLREAKAAVLAALECSDLPVCVTMTFGEDGRTFLGTTPSIAATTLSPLGVQAVGVNCSLGPSEMLDAVRQIVRFARCPVMAQPNAGLPHVIDGETVYDTSAEEFAAAMKSIVEAGATIIGSCCGSDPGFTTALRTMLDAVGEPHPVPHEDADAFVACSAQQAVVLQAGASDIAVIGERINPTGKKRLRAALLAGDTDYVVAEAVSQTEAGADILDVNVGLPEVDEPALLHRCVEELQATITTPLQLDSADPEAIERTAREYAGRPMINSVNGKAQSLREVLPIVARYGCTVVGLTLDENGIPSTAEERVAIAVRIVDACEATGIPRADVAIDCLTMAAATNQDEAREILRAVSMVKEQLGVRTVLGVSNISFGLPKRALMNVTFLAAAFGAGLDMPILDPTQRRYRDTVDAFRVICGQDGSARRYLEEHASSEDPYEATCTAQANASESKAARTNDEKTQDCPIEVSASLSDAADQVAEIADYVLSGRSAPMPEAIAALLESHDSLDIVNGVFTPLLDIVGQKYDSGEFFLPQLMASAEAVKAGFDVIRAHQLDSGKSARATNEPTASPTRADNKIVVATVEGDIHDIGKNIVRMLLENYGFDVIDLGRDVTPEAIVEAVKENDVRLVGLSALMTTTVKAMERTIKRLREQAPHASVIVGGAVLTPDYAAEIGADFYAKDAAESARIASRFFAN